MIQRLYIYKTDSTDPYHNIATEKMLLESVEPGSCILYLWQNKNTVVIGRNQNAWVECRSSLLEQEGGKLARRLSGGGAVYHDLGNLNFTFIMCKEEYDLDRQLSVIETACSYAGISVERSGRNDLLAEGCKFSGNAFFHTQEKAYHHGTLLVSADMEKLGRYLTPSKAKLQAKGVASVRSRVINLRALAPTLDCNKLGDYMEQAFSQVYGYVPETFPLSPAQHTQIEQYQQELCSWQWLYGPKLPFTAECSARFNWGDIHLLLQAESGCIKAVQVYSDAMQWDLADHLNRALIGCRINRNVIKTALDQTINDPVIRHDILCLIEQQIL